ncbi:MAG: ketopantoate reductase family protein, partial [Halobacteriales archaeon]
REHRVTLLGRDPHVRAVREDGLRITGEVDLTVSLEAATEIDSTSEPDLAVVTVKSFDTAGAARTLARAHAGAVLSLQNGMGNEASLADHLDCPVLAGTTTCGARLHEPGVVACTGIGDVTVGPHADAPLAPAERAGTAFRSAGIEADVVADPRPHLWEKLAVNAGINPVTALARIRNGTLVDGPPRGVAMEAATETAAVARDHGISLSGDDARAAVLEVAEATARNRSSMLVDVAAGRRTEIDAINGFVLDRAERAVPVNETLAGLIRAWEASEGVR